MGWCWCLCALVLCAVHTTVATPTDLVATPQLAPTTTAQDDPQYAQFDDLEMYVGLESKSNMVTSMLQMARRTFDSDAITLTVQCDMTRLRSGELNRIASQWRGPISVAVLSDSQDSISSYLNGNANSDVLEWADVTAVVSSGYLKYYPINKMRNFALGAARTDFVFILDIDEHIPSMDRFREQLLRAKPGTPPHTVFVVPSWQWGVSSPGVGVPASFYALKDLSNRGMITVKHPWFPQAYSIPERDLEWWISLKSARKVKYSNLYEPYMIVRRSVLPMFDERFVGYGGNKAILTLRLAFDHFEFRVLPRVFAFDNATPSQYKPRKVTNRQLMEDAWWEVGKEHGCNNCKIRSCVEDCSSQIGGGLSEPPPPSATNFAATGSDQGNETALKTEEQTAVADNKSQIMPEK